MSDQIVCGDYASLHCDDEEDNDGYYIVQWTSEPYTEQEGKEELMCNAVYLEKEQQIKDCYYKTEQTVEVRLQHVLKTGIQLEQITDGKLLPRGVRKKNDIIKRGLYKVNSDDIEDIFQEIRCREALEHIEEEPSLIDDDETNSTVDDTDKDEDISDEGDDESNDDNVC